MKQRITYLLPKGTEVNPETIRINESQVNFTQAHHAAIERRVTVGLSELPNELSSLLKHIHELHIRWSSPSNYATAIPLVSRLPAALHVFFTPRKGHDVVNVCPLLKLLFGAGLKCQSTIATFSTPPMLSERFSHAAAYQYAVPLSTTDDFQAFVAQQICQLREDCVDAAITLSSAKALDLDFDAISHAVTLTTFWPPSGVSGGTGGVARKYGSQDSVEVGVLEAQDADADEPEELKLGGFLVDVGETENPSPTLFSFPSRHHPLSPTSRTTFSASFQNPTGLHPKLSLTLPRKHLAAPKPPGSGSCALHAYLTLPSELFIDSYQLSDPHFLASQNLVALRSLSGENDLEAPDWVVHGWGSAALLELALPDPASLKTVENDWIVTIPTHLRYVSSSSNRTHNSPPDHETITIPWPVLFWACEAEEGLKMSVNPFDRVNLGYDGLFGPKTMFYHIPASPAEGQMLLETLDVPVLNPQKATWVRAGTLWVVVLGFAWVCWQLLKPKGNSPRRAIESGAVEEKKER